MTTVEILKEMAFTATETQRRALEDAISTISESKGDLISRERLINEWDDLGRRYAMPTTPIHKRAFREFPSADVRESEGEWIYDKSIYNWRCSKCGQTPPPTGYVGKAEFMATYFKFCNHCGADMRGKA